MTLSRKRKKSTLQAEDEFEASIRDGFDFFRLQDDEEDDGKDVGMFEEADPTIGLKQLSPLFMRVSGDWDEAVLAVAPLEEISSGKFTFATVRLLAETLPVWKMLWYSYSFALAASQARKRH